jgi:hypothetical protein
LLENEQARLFFRVSTFPSAHSRCHAAGVSQFNSAAARITTNQAAIIALFRVVNRYVGNLAPMPGVFPDYPAPVIRNTETGRELTMMRWGMPPPPRAGGYPVTNIRNTASPHWRPWPSRENRCLVPFNSFAEYAPEPNPGPVSKEQIAEIAAMETVIADLDAKTYPVFHGRQLR